MKKINNLEGITDADGFLSHPSLWNEEIAIDIAGRESIELREQHWNIIYISRQYYQEEQKFPKIRVLIALIKEKYGQQLGNSLYLQQLFPISPVLQISKISGLPKPNRCI